MLYDLASLAKPLVTAPLALAFLDLDADRRWALGLAEREPTLTVRQLLSHSSGLPPWRPYTGEPLAAHLHRAVRLVRGREFRTVRDREERRPQIICRLLRLHERDNVISEPEAGLVVKLDGRPVRIDMVRAQHGAHVFKSGIHVAGI